MQCLHDPFQQTSSLHIWSEQPDVIVDSINTVGCLDVLRRPIETSLALYIVAIVFILLLYFLIFCVARILYTSCRNAILLADPEGISPGWLFGRGDCGYTGGSTLIEVMEMRGSDESKQPTKVKFAKKSPKSQGESTHTPSQPVINEMLADSSATPRSAEEPVSERELSQLLMEKTTNTQSPDDDETTATNTES